VAKQTVSVAFDAGIDTKTDPKQVRGKLLALQNAIFQTPRKIRKRNGYIPLPSLGAGVALSTFNNELVTLDGNNVYSYNASGQTMQTKGPLPTVSLNVQSIVRNTNQQTTQDVAINGSLQCFTYSDSGGGCRYSVFDTATGQSIVNNAILASTAQYSKVLAVVNFFVILYYDSTSMQLFYKAINIATPATLGSAVQITSDANAGSVCWDATVINGSIFLVYNNQAAKLSLYSLSSTLVLSSQTNFGTDNANVVTIFGDASFNVWVAYAINGNATPTNTNINVFALSNNLGSTVLAKTNIDSFLVGGVGPAINTMTGIVTGTTATVYYEVVQSPIVPGIMINFVKQNTVTTGGSVGSASVFKRGVGLAAKAISYQSNYYLVLVYQSNLQPTYFLVRGDGIQVGKAATSEAGGYSVKPILPEFVNPSAGVYMFASLIKDSLTVQNGILSSQTGVQSATFTFSSAAPSKFVLGQNLHFGGAMLKMYDGGGVVEHGFNLYPDSMYTTWNQNSPTYGGGVGFLTALGAINQKQYCAVYEWTDNQGQNHQSAPSVPIAVDFNTLVAPTTITGDIQSSGIPPGGNTIANASGGAIGQYITLIDGVPGKIINAQIVNVSGSTLTVSPAWSNLSASAGHHFLLSNYPLSIFSEQSISGSLVVTGFLKNAQAQFGQVIQAPPGFTSNYPANTWYKSGAYSSTTGLFDTNNPPTGAGNTTIYYGIGAYSVPLNVPTLKMTDKKNVSIAVYATAVNGTVFFRASSPTSLIYNDPTVDYITFNDTVPDNILLGNQQLYTTSGEVENLAAPAIDFSFNYKSRSIAVQSENRLSFIYSKQVIPGVPVEYNPLVFIQNVDSKIGSVTAGGQLDDKMILFGPTSKFYVVGDGPTLSGNLNDFSPATKISGNTGCTNPASVIEVDDGLMYQDPTQGIWLLDRSLQEHYIGAEVEAYNGFKVTSAQLIKGVTQVRFSLTNGTVLVYDYVARQWSTFTNHSANDACIFQNLYTFIKSNGAIWQESPGTFTDGDGSAILIYLLSGWIQMSDIQGFQRIHQLLFLGTYYSAHSLVATIYTDFNPTPVQVSNPFSIPSFYPPQERVFLTSQKCEAMQIALQESQTSPFGQGFDLSNVQLVIGQKRGAYKVPAAVSTS
jgi:hypothetical protein